ncbi:MAG: ACP S-malonyltransferase [Clostridium sp.]
MSKIAFIFPGQGAQICGMGQDFYEQTETGRQVFDMASEVLGFSMPELCFEKNDRLDITEYTQPAMVTASIAMMEVLKERTGIRPDAAAGLSLGEYPAMVAAGVMSKEDAIHAVRQRGILMQEAVPAGVGAMAAVLAMDAARIEEVLAPIEGVRIANYNCPGQIVISGIKEAVEEAAVKLKENGAKRVLPLNVSGPFHSYLLEGAGEELGNVLEKIEIHTPQIPYVANVTAEYVYNESEVKPLLIKQVSSSVRWEQSIRRMLEDGIDTFIEIGPGKTLSGFMRKIDKNARVFNIEKLEDIEKLADIEKLEDIAKPKDTGMGQEETGC